MGTDFEGVGSDVVDCSFKIHMHSGPGLLESAYKALLARDLLKSPGKLATALSKLQSFA